MTIAICLGLGVLIGFAGGQAFAIWAMRDDPDET